MPLKKENQIVRNIVGQYGVANPETRHAVSLGQCSGHEKIGILGHQMDHGLSGETNEGFIHQETCFRMEAQQFRQGGHVEDTAIGVVGVHDDRERGVVRNHQFGQVKGKVIFRW